MPLSLDGTGSITGIVTVSVSDDLGHVGDTNTKIRFPAADTISFETAGSERLRINSDGKVGLGTTGSDYALSIREADNNNKFLMLQRNSGQEILQIREDGDNHAIIDGSHASGELHFYTAGVEKARITSDGKVGIGTINPQGQLHISSGTSGDCELIIEADTDNNDEDDNPRIVFKQDGGLEESAVGMDNNTLILANSVSSGGIVFKTGTTTGYTNATERLRIGSDGKVGIGTDNPSSLLTLDHATNPSIQFKDSGTKVASINAEGTSTNIASFESKDLVFACSTSSAFTERLRIASDGATKVCHNGGAFGVGGDPINKFGITASDNNFFGLHRSNASTGTGEFNINVEVNSQVTFSMDDEGAFSFGTSTDPSAQSGYSEKLRINSSGYVTKPNQPCAVVYQCTGPAGGAANASSDNKEPLHFDHVHINQGGMTISQNNARIQVPVTGIYFVSYMVSGTVTNVDLNDGIELVLLRNGNEYPATNSGAEPVFNFGAAANQEEFFCNNTLLVSLTGGDYVEAALDNIGSADATINRGNFSVMLMA